MKLCEKSVGAILLLGVQILVKLGVGGDAVCCVRPFAMRLADGPGGDV